MTAGLQVSVRRLWVRSTSLISVVSYEGSMLECLKGFNRLQELQITFWSSVLDGTNEIDFTRDTDFTRILLHVQSAHLKRLSISLRTERSYHRSRDQVMNSLVGHAMQQVLSSFEQLGHFQVLLCDNNEDFNAAWWTNQLRVSLPMTKAIVACEVTVKTSE